MARTIAERQAVYNAARDRLETLGERIKSSADGSDAEAEAIREYDHARVEADSLKLQLEDAEADIRAREVHKTRGIALSDGGFGRIDVNEPDMYVKGGRSFMQDMFADQILGDLSARARLTDHQQYEIEKRSMTSGTFGGLVPPEYLLDLYAKAPRNGRKFLDSCNHQDLPETGMNLIIPRLTTGTAAGMQTAENQAVATQDMVETDLTIPVRTIAGYVPVSRQGIERAQYNEQILFEDGVARIWSKMDAQAINGDGNNGDFLGMNQTAGINVVPITGWSLPDLWGALADAQQRIATAVGGLGYEATTICMSPARWGAICSMLDANDRPILLPMSGSGVGFNTAGSGSAAGYGVVGQLFGLDVITDASIPVTQGIGDNEDIILVYSSPVQHLWERPNDPITVAFAQTAATTLTLTLIFYSYASYSSGRFPSSVAVLTGPGLTPPTFGTPAT